MDIPEPLFDCLADNAKVDVYAFSMILFELIEGRVWQLPTPEVFALPLAARSWKDAANMALD